MVTWGRARQAAGSGVGVAPAAGRILSARRKRATCARARGAGSSARMACAWFRTRKGRGYGKYDNKSHGAPHGINSEPFWRLRREFMEKYGVEYDGVLVYDGVGFLQGVAVFAGVGVYAGV